MKFLYCFLYLIISGIIIFLIGRIFPRKWIKEHKFPFKSFAFEKNGNIYEKLNVKKWKTRLPDASTIIHKVLPKFMPVKRIKTSATIPSALITSKLGGKSLLAKQSIDTATPKKPNNLKGIE